MSRESKMMSFKLPSLFLGAVLSLCFVSAAPAVHADELNQATQFRFRAPVEVPGNVVLPAGTYWFQIMPEHARYPNAVQIFNSDHTHLFATLLTNSVARPGAFPDNYFHSDHSELVFAERRHGQPMALLDWFYTDRVTGHQFVYPRHEEERLSADQQITVTVEGS
jgi:hypothetical protein